VVNSLQIELQVNNKLIKIDVDYNERLIDVLRNKLGYTSVKEGCGEGECGACTVIMDGQAVNSCLVLAYQARGKSIITVEGLSQGEKLDVIQQAFLNNGAVQCGYCTPGMILSAKALLLNNPHPTEEEIRLAIAGNICRCTGYVNIVKAIQEASNNAN
jgi:carbon-monoxide dehydrogenase small subunit